MRIIKPYGQSETQKRQKQSTLRHRILRRKNEECVHNLEDFAQQSPDLVIAQWISVLDKIITKPKKEEKATPSQEKCRQEISDAMWPLLKKKLLKHGINDEDGTLEKKWQFKVHPYSVDAENGSGGQSEIKGRWYQTFCGDIDPKNIDAVQLATEIEKHLYENQKRIARNANPKRTGLIPLRAKSIDQNFLEKDLERENPKIDQSYFAEGDVAAEIYNEIKKENAAPKKALTIVAEKLRTHYATIFVDQNGRVMPIHDAKTHPLFPSHDLVKTAYRRLFKGSRKRRNTLLKVTPSDKIALETLIQNRSQNTKINNDIRLGKIIHYELMKIAAAHPKKAHEKHWDECIKKVENSDFWLTQGQITIKQNEAFQRVWRSSVTLMARGLRICAGLGIEKPGEKPMDILASDKKKTVPDDFDHSVFHDQINLLYGHSAKKLLKRNDKDESENLYKFMKEALRTLRNRSFHPTNFVTFCKEIKEIGEGQDDYSDHLTEFWQSHLKRRHEHLIDSLIAVHSHAYFNEGQNKMIIELVQKHKTGELPLPRFNRVLDRAKNVGHRGVKLPDPAKASRLEKQPALRCQYTILKLLYEKPFCSSLEDLSSEKLRQYIKKSTERATEQARKINKNGNQNEFLIIARSANLISDQNANITMKKFFNELTAATATEMRVQNYYCSNAEEARKQAKYIDHLKVDVLIFAFHDWIKDNNFEWVLELKKSEDSPIPESQCELEVYRNQVPVVNGEKWQKTLFLLLFLMPASPANRLVHQFRKWEIVGTKSNRPCEDRKLAEQLITVFDLYMNTHNSFQDGKQAIEENNDTLKELFEQPENDFDKVFPKTLNPQDTGHLPIRGLREMLRFSDVRLMKHIFEKAPIRHKTVEAWCKQKDDIAQKQERRAELHEILSKKKNKNYKCDIKEYKELQLEISTFRECAHQTCLTNHLNLYVLTIELLARLVDFSGLFERDLYFEMLAHFYHNKVRFTQLKNRGLLAEGRIYEFCKYNKERLKESQWPDRLKCSTLEEIRNDFAHFNVLTPNEPPNLTKQINRARRLMAYDRKLKNAVSKSIIDLLHREGIKLEWQMTEKHQLNAPSLSSRKIKHLKKNTIQEALRGKDFMKMVVELFKGKVKKPSG